MAIGSIWELTINWACAGWSNGAAHNVLHYRQTETDDPDPEEFAALTAAWFEADPGAAPKMNELYKTDVSIDTISLREVDPMSPLIQVGTADLPTAGVNTGESLPDQCALLFSTRTALSGRSYRGRHYMPAMVEGAQEAGVWNFSTPNDLADNWAAYFSTGAAGLTGAMEYGVWSQTVPTFTVITAVKVDTRVRRIGKRQVRAPLYA